MTHRIQVSTQDRHVVLELHGLLDAPALATVRAALEFARGEGRAVRVVLRAGAEVERSCLAGVRDLDAEIVAESPYLAAWLARGAR